MDCTYGQNLGCKGGSLDTTYNYVKGNGISTESQYPYTGKVGSCSINGGSTTIRGFRNVYSCEGLKTAIKMNPVTVSVDALTWQHYSGGIMNNCGTSLDHAVLAVGYDTAGNWKVKNQWSSSWGEKGYIRLAPGNTCGICQQATYPYL